MLWWHVLVGIFSILMCALYWKKRKFRVMETLAKNDIMELPIVGHAYIFLGSDEDRMNAFQSLGRQAIKHGGITSAWMIHQFYIVVADPDIAQILLKTCLEKGYVTQFLKYVLGNGSIFAPVSIWRPRRKILTPTFSPKNLSHFVKIFSKQSAVMAEELRSAAGKGPFSVWSYLTTYTMDSVCESTLGVQMNSQKNPNQPFLKAFDVFSQLLAARMCQPWLYNDTVYKMLPQFKHLTKAKNYMCNFIDQIIQSKRKSFKDEQIEKKDLNHNATQEPTKEEKDSLRTFLELIMESSGGEKGYTDLELQEETLVMVMAGTDTSAVGTAFTAVMLSRHPDVQDKIFYELNEVFGDSSRPLVNDDLLRLKYLDAVIRETLRLYPPVPVTARSVTSDVTLPSGQTILAGTNVIINMWAIHRNPLYWGPDAEEFRPERFLDPQFKHPAQFMPFSYGPRNCLGGPIVIKSGSHDGILEKSRELFKYYRHTYSDLGYQYAMMSMKTALSTLLRKYRVLPAVLSNTASNGNCKPKQHRPLRVKFDIMMKDVDNFIIELEPRT